MGKIFHRIVSIRNNILINFIIVISLISASLLLLQDHFSEKMAVRATQTTFKQIAQKITRHLEDNDRLLRMILLQMQLYPGITVEPARVKLPENAYRLIRTISPSKKFTLRSMYVGYPNGHLLDVMALNASPQLLKRFHAPPATRWMVARVLQRGSGRIWHYDFFSQSLRWLGSWHEPTRFDARTRPWYILACEKHQAVRSPPYLFANLAQKGITYSQEIGNTGVVVAIDFTLKDLDTLLKKQIFAPTAKVEVFDGKGHLISSSDGASTTDPVFLEISKGSPSRQNKVFIHGHGKNRRFTMVMPLPNRFGAHTNLGFSVDAAVMMKPYLKSILYAIGAALIALLLSLPLILHVTTRIVRPIRELMKENEKIKHRKFSEVRPVQTYIMEFMDLSDSLLSMSRSIQTYEKSLENMMEDFVRLIAEAIDTKSPYTGEHCKRVPVLALKLAKAVSVSRDKTSQSLHLETEDDWKAFEMGAWLHDCGKITTPEHIVDKATRLETIYNRIHEIRTRFEVVWRDIDIQFYERLLKGEDRKQLEAWRETERARLLEDFTFVARCNMGNEIMNEEKKARLRRIAGRSWLRHFSNRIGISDMERERFGGKKESPLPVLEPLLADRPEHLIPRTHFNAAIYQAKGFKLDVPSYLQNLGEIYNLSIERGTLTPEEIFIIREHVIMTIDMLEKLPYPEGLKKIPEFAGTHHEALDGSGYPRRLKGDELSIPARMMAIADVFEALTASDRPYKKGKKVSEALKIMRKMVLENHLDGELFSFFVRNGIYQEYAEEYLHPDQLDSIDEEELLNFHVSNSQTGE